MQTLFDWGWTAELADHFDQLPHDDLIPARVVRQDRQQYLVRSRTRMHTAFLLGKMQYAASDPSQMPAVGDWVAIEAFDDEQAIVHAVLPRFSAFMRKEAGGRTRQQVIAANIDTVFLVSGLDHDFNLRRIERYLVQAASSGATPVIVLNKADLCDDVAARLAEVLGARFCRLKLDGSLKQRFQLFRLLIRHRFLRQGLDDWRALRPLA